MHENTSSEYLRSSLYVWRYLTFWDISEPENINRWPRSYFQQ